jgi:hypothetical protein
VTIFVLLRPRNLGAESADPFGDRSLVRARIRGVVDYSSKLGCRRDVVDDVDLQLRHSDSRMTDRHYPISCRTVSPIRSEAAQPGGCGVRVSS